MSESNKYTSIKINGSQKQNKKYTTTNHISKNISIPISNLQNQTEKMKFLYNFISNDAHANSINKIITEEANNVDNPKYKNKIKNINLIEKDIDSLYKWDHLFNNFKPLSSYTTLIKNNKIDTITEENQDDIIFKNPSILVDLTQHQMNLFFGRNNPQESQISKKRSQSSKKSIKIKTDKILNTSNNIRPKSLYENREADSAFYFSSTFNDYYKEDLKTFSEKMPILKPKLYFKKNKIKREIKGHLIKMNEKEKFLANLINLQNILLKKQDLIIAARRNNPAPLLKSIFKQNFPGYEVQDEPKMYFKTMKPYGNNPGEIDYSKNERWRFCEEMAKLRNAKSKNNVSNNENSRFFNDYKHKNNKIILSYYDDKDPYINIFNKKAGNIHKKNKSINVNIKEEINYLKKSYTNRTIKIEEKINLPNDKENKENKESNENNIKLNKDEKYKNVDAGESKKIICSMKQKTSQPQKKLSNENNNNRSKSETTKTELPYDYCNSICFPVKKSSNVGNISYNKINQLLKERQLYSVNKKEYFLTRSSTIKNASAKKTIKEDKAIGNVSAKKTNIEFKIEAKVKIKPKRNLSLYREALNDDKRFKTVYHWDRGGNLIKKPNVKYFCFNDYVDTVFMENNNNVNVKKSIDANNKLEKKLNDIESVISTEKNLDKDKTALS